MRNQIEQRLMALEAECDAGKKLLNELEAKRVSVTQTLLRIEGAMQVLRELLAERSPAADGNHHATPARV